VNEGLPRDRSRSGDDLLLLGRTGDIPLSVGGSGGIARCESRGRRRTLQSALDLRAGSQSRGACPHCTEQSANPSDVLFTVPFFGHAGVGNHRASIARMPSYVDKHARPGPAPRPSARRHHAWTGGLATIHPARYTLPRLPAAGPPLFSTLFVALPDLPPPPRSTGALPPSARPSGTAVGSPLPPRPAVPAPSPPRPTSPQLTCPTIYSALITGPSGSSACLRKLTRRFRAPIRRCSGLTSGTRLFWLLLLRADHGHDQNLALPGRAGRLPAQPHSPHQARYTLSNRALPHHHPPLLHRP